MLHNKLIEIILGDMEASKLFTVEARKNLYLRHISALAAVHKTKTEEIAELYNLSKRFGVAWAVPILSEFLSVPQYVINKRLYLAREKGLVKKVSSKLTNKS